MSTYYHAAFDQTLKIEEPSVLSFPKDLLIVNEPHASKQVLHCINKVDQSESDFVVSQTPNSTESKYKLKRHDA